jgi:hypothetical protein
MRLRIIYMPDDEMWGVELDGQPAVRFMGCGAHERAVETAAELRERLADEADDDVNGVEMASDAVTERATAC